MLLPNVSQLQVENAFPEWNRHGGLDDSIGRGLGPWPLQGVTLCHGE